MIAGFAFLLICQLAGEALVRGLGLPIPGPVLGMGLMTVALGVWSAVTESDHMLAADHPVGRVADGLLASLSLMFIPAGVGVVQYLDLIGTYGVAIIASLLVSTLLTLLATVGTYVAIKRVFLGHSEEGRP